MIKTLLKIAVAVLAISFAWQFFTGPPSTRSICYTWSKATDPLTQFEENGIDGAQWLADNVKSPEDLSDLHPEVLKALKLYEEGAILEDVDPYERMGLRKFVIDACEKVEPGSTDH